MKFSLITINLNNKIGLEKTIQSIRNQTFTDFEYIIIDGGSVDGSLSVIMRYSNNINNWISEQDKGIYNAMNKGIIKTTGEYLLFLNSGDCLVNPKVLEIANNCENKADLIYGNLIRKKTNKKYKIVKYPGKLSFYHFYANVPSLHQQATFIKRTLFDNYGYFREDFKIISDWEFFLRCIILNNCSTKYIDLNITLFDSTGISSNPSFDESHLKIQILKSLFPPRVLDDYEDLKEIKKVFLAKIKEGIIKHKLFHRHLLFFYKPLQKAKEFLIYMQNK
jgi:glycosyltransferase involved in cell wall biosynthesis